MPRYSLTPDAESDLLAIWRFTHDRWGMAQADHYLSGLERCFDALGAVPSRSLRMAGTDVRFRRCQHHIVVWIVETEPVVIAVLHERMDFIARLSGRLSP